MAERKTYRHRDTRVEREYPVTLAARFPALEEVGVVSLPIDPITPTTLEEAVVEFDEDSDALTEQEL